MGNLTCTASGAVANFYTPYAVPIRSFKVHFSPKQSGTGDPSPENVRPIEGWTGVTGYRCGKNLFDESSVTFGVWTSSGGTINSAQYGCITDKIPVNNDSKFAIARFGANPYSYSLIEYDSQGNFIARNHTGVVTNTFVVSTLNANTKYIALQVATNYITLTQKMLSSYKMMLVFGTEMPSVYEPYHCDEIPVSFGDLGTIYGGYVDLVTGDVVQEYDRYMFTGSEDDLISYYDTHVAKGIERHLFQSRALDRIVARNCTNKCFSDKFALYGNGTANTPIIFTIGTPVRQTGFFVDSTLLEPTVESFCEWLSNNNMELVYLLETPITHTLSPQTLSTLVHSNAFWSNADSVEIEYDLAECGDIKEIRRRILLNTPHLESASGSVAHFSTDMASKLKECKVNFLPQQAGSGDPSPSNVRAISGWTGMTVERCGKNLFDGVLVNKSANPDGSDSDNDLRLSSGFTPIKPGTYTVSFDSNFSVALYVFASNQAGTQLSGESHIYCNTSPLTFTITNGKYYRIKFKHNTLSIISPNDLTDIQLELGSESTAYEPYQSNQITVSWQDLGTIYGGFIDVLRGELVQEWGIIASYNGETLPSEWISDRDVYSPHATPTTGAQVAYKLATPITYPLTPEIIKALKGVNNVFSDANGDVEVKFWTH